ncbi:hypothetical protein BC628DRAFT_546476 [Trametes gibbosa]|nr:hypothetical protein BC628DRAFT_546476 [Trametes gibbosa]
MPTSYPRPVVPYVPKLSIQELPQCGHCEKVQPQLEVRLKRCTGCTVTYYCSKECQKASWPRHKYLCRNSNKELGGEIEPSQLGGYPALIALEDAVAAWGEVHAVSFTNIASTTAHLNGGIAYNLTSSQSIVVRMRPRPQNAPGEKTPANAFQLVDVCIAPMSTFREVAGGWDNTRTQCERVMENIHRDVPDRTYMGVIPTVFIVVNTGFASFRGLPLYRRLRDDSKPIAPQERALMEDIRQMCMGVVDAGLVMCASTGGRRYGPEVGPLVLRKKKWEWKKMGNWDWSVIGMNHPGTTRTGLHPIQIWKKYYDL